MSSDNNVIKKKTFDFAVRIVKLYKYLVEEKKEYTLGRQILRSGTSIGANVEEGAGGYTRKDFRSKMSLSYKETRETKGSVKNKFPFQAMLFWI